MSFSNGWEIVCLLRGLAKGMDRAKWTKLMRILKETGIDCRERRLITKFYVDQRVKIRLDQGESGNMKIERGVRQGCCLSPILFKLIANTLSRSLSKGFGEFNVEGQAVRTGKYAITLCYWVRKEGTTEYDW
jgi:hypothetical protein